MSRQLAHSAPLIASHQPDLTAKCSSPGVAVFVKPKGCGNAAWGLKSNRPVEVSIVAKGAIPASDLWCQALLLVCVSDEVAGAQ